MLFVLGILAAVLACLLAVAIVLYERELRRMARFLRRRDRTVNERATVAFPTPGVTALGAAVNEELDALREERVAMEERQAAFRRDLAALSHDIRTPLAGAQGYLQLHARTQSEAERRRCLDEAAARLSAMRELTDRLFEYAKAADEDSPLEVGRTEVLPVLAEVLAGAYPQFAERGWEPQIDFQDESAAVMADEEALGRVFSNLLANALRHGASAPRIAQRTEGEGVAGRVFSQAETRSASASGAAQAVRAWTVVTFANRVERPEAVDAARLFERFYRADGARSGGGSGLGLAIVASLVGRMGGTVEARVEGDELSIAVRLPCA